MIDASPLAERLAPSIGQRLGNKAGGADIAGLALVFDLIDAARSMAGHADRGPGWDCTDAPREGWGRVEFGFFNNQIAGSQSGDSGEQTGNGQDQSNYSKKRFLHDDNPLARRNPKKDECNRLYRRSHSPG